MPKLENSARNKGDLDISKSGCDKVRDNGSETSQEKRLIEEKSSCSKAYSSKYSHGSSAGMIVGLPQTWPVLTPAPYFSPTLTTGNGNTSPFPKHGNGTLGGNKRLSPIPPHCRPLHPSQTMTRYPSKGTIPSVRNKPAPIPEVTIPRLFSVNGKTKLEFKEQIDHFIDGLRVEPGSSEMSARAAAQLTNQIFIDNNELLYILVTDVASYPISSPKQLWQEEEGVGETEQEEMSALIDNGKKMVAFNCLFNVGAEIFVLFLFSPTDIVFNVETNFSERNHQVASIFFHGISRVSMSQCQHPRRITIHFLGDHEDAK